MFGLGGIFTEALADLGLEQPDIREVDVNPLIVTPKGNVVAVDALVVLDECETPAAGECVDEKEKRRRYAEIRAALDVMANAKSIAVVGATRPEASGLSGP